MVTELEMLNGYRARDVESTYTKPFYVVIKREKSQFSLSI